MLAPNRIGDVIAAIGFLTALIAIVSTPIEREGMFSRTFKWIAAGFLVIFVWLTGLDAIGLTHLSEIGDLFEDYAQVLPAVIALGGVYILHATQQYGDVARAHRALAQSHDLMMTVVDQAPAGIMLLDPAGRIAFANDTAKQILDLDEDETCGRLSGPGWVVSGDPSAEPDRLGALVEAEAFQCRTVRLDWPNGWFADLRVSGRPMSDAHGRLGGVVVMFESAQGGAEARP